MGDVLSKTGYVQNLDNDTQECLIMKILKMVRTSIIGFSWRPVCVLHLIPSSIPRPDSLMAVIRGP